MAIARFFSSAHSRWALRARSELWPLICDLIQPKQCDWSFGGQGYDDGSIRSERGRLPLERKPVWVITWDTLFCHSILEVLPAIELNSAAIPNVVVGLHNKRDWL